MDASFLGWDFWMLRMGRDHRRREVGPQGVDLLATNDMKLLLGMAAFF